MLLQELKQLLITLAFIINDEYTILHFVAYMICIRLFTTNKSLCQIIIQTALLTVLYLYLQFQPNCATSAFSYEHGRQCSQIA